MMVTCSYIPNHTCVWPCKKQKLKKKIIDDGRTRTCAGEPTWFRVKRLNHSATSSSTYVTSNLINQKRKKVVQHNTFWFEHRETVTCLCSCATQSLSKCFLTHQRGNADVPKKLLPPCAGIPTILAARSVRAAVFSFFFHPRPIWGKAQRPGNVTWRYSAIPTRGSLSSHTSLPDNSTQRWLALKRNRLRVPWKPLSYVL